MNYACYAKYMLDSKLLMNDPIPYLGLIGALRGPLEV